MLTDPLEDYRRGSVPFLGVTVRLDSHPLIPRTETEYWVEKAIRNMGGVRRAQIRVVDLFAGSGAIGLAVLKHIPNAHVTFAEINPAHFPTIKKSMTENTIDPARAGYVQTDVWSHIPTPPLLTSDVKRGGYDAVLANPPYVSQERGTVSGETLAHEPHEALFAEEDGFFFIRKTIEGLTAHLAPEGRAWIEHEPFHTPRIHEHAKKHGLAATTHHDQYGVERFTHCTRQDMA